MIGAAGGALWRPTAEGIEIALVHRPRYDDWSLPKGKLHSAEPAVVGAAREVAEETGCTAAVHRWLARTSYRVGGEAKVVDYWAMRYAEGEFAPNDEVDELRWLTPADAARLLARDRLVLDALRERPVDTTTVLLVRHARAGSKDRWRGDDSLRPLDRTGRRQAHGLTPLIAVFHPARVLSAERARCVDTVGPLAAHLGLVVETDPVFNEAPGSDAAQAADRLRSLARAGEPVAVCSQGGLIPETVAILARKTSVTPASAAAGKGSVWALSFDRDAGLVGADYYPPPTRRVA